MHCAVGAVNFSALTDLAVAFAALLHLRTAIAISRQHLFVTSYFFFNTIQFRATFMCSFLTIYTTHIETQ
jgi:hypothetical protein